MDAACIPKKRRRTNPFVDSHVACPEATAEVLNDINTAHPARRISLRNTTRWAALDFRLGACSDFVAPTRCWTVTESSSALASPALPHLLASISKTGGSRDEVGPVSPMSSPRAHAVLVKPPSTPERRAMEDAPSPTSGLPRGIRIKSDVHNHVVDSHAIRVTGQVLNEHTKALEKVVAFAGSVLLAAASKAAHHVSSHHVFSRDREKGKDGRTGRNKRGGRSDGRRASFVNPSFSDSFSLPWKHHRHEKESSRTTRELAESIASRGLDYERGMDVRAAVQCFEEAVKLQPDNLAHLCMAAKQWSDLTFFHDVTTERERQVVNRKAIEFAERAISLHPESPGGYLGLCVAKGRLALFTDNKTKVKLAKEAHEAAHKAVQYGPKNDIAWHVTGRWHAEMAKLNVVVRTIVKVMYGTALESGSKEDALRAYMRAIELAPDRLIHYVETGRVLMELNRKEEARKYLEASLEKDVEDINAWQTRHDAEELLAKLNNSRWDRPSNTPPNVPDRRDHTKFSTNALLGDHPLRNDLSDDNDKTR